MTKAELIEMYERRRAEAAQTGAMAPLAKVYRVVLDELGGLDGVDVTEFVGTAQASKVWGVSSKTAAKWLKDGRCPGAHKTSGKNGEWRIPTREVHALNGARAAAPSTRPRLWRAGDG